MEFGFAQKRFHQELEKENASAGPRWPRLQLALQMGYIAYADFAIAEMLCERLIEPSEGLAAFICYISLCTRIGHLCVYKTESHLAPGPETVWLIEENDKEYEALHELCQELNHLQIELPSTLLTEIDDPTIEVHTPLCVYNNRYYFQKYWFFETMIHKALKELSQVEPKQKVDSQSVEKFLETSFKLNVLQKNAVLNAAKSCLTILAGGPGTGKSYTASALIQALFQSENLKIIVAAPTGKATNNLKNQLAAFSSQIAAKTLHSLLGIGMSFSNAEEETKKLDADLIVIDESSMIDVKLFSLLLTRIKIGARLVLIGDPYQLPPVEVGTIFKDLIKILKEIAPSSVTTLQSCLRAENTELVHFADWVKEGDEQQINRHLASGSAKAVRFISIPWNKNGQANQRQIIEDAIRQFPTSQVNEGLSPKELIGKYDTFRILSPLKNGPLGVLELNQKIHEKRHKFSREGSFFTAPIIITANDYRLNLFNGETGVLFLRKGDGRIDENFAYFPAPDSEGGFRKIPQILLPQFDYAYCISVHKSQGSEFQNVLLILPEGSEKFGREVLYTAVTRSKKSLEIFTQNTTLLSTIQHKNERLSRLFNP